jgi:7-keto-8-aminopelargonate synthetase-like enzyme
MKNRTMNLINELVIHGKNRKLGHLTTEDNYYDGKYITIEGKKLLNFGLCSYLGLELDQRIKDAAKDAIDRYGIHYSCSRTYVSTTLYTEFEKLIGQIFDAEVVISTSLSIGHHTVMPIIVQEGDAVILDQQVHSSVQDAALKLKALGVTVTVIRHNDLSELKKKRKNFL